MKTCNWPNSTLQAGRQAFHRIWGDDKTANSSPPHDPMLTLTEVAWGLFYNNVGIQED